MSNAKPKDVERVVPDSVEGGICKTGENGENRSRNVSENWRPEIGQRPVFTDRDCDVQVAGQLITLFQV